MDFRWTDEQLPLRDAVANFAREERPAWMTSVGRRLLHEPSHTKLRVSEAWVSTCLYAMQIHGGKGCMVDFLIERWGRTDSVAEADTWWKPTLNASRDVRAKSIRLFGNSHA